MKIIHTYYCPDCEEVFSRAKDIACPSCTNRSTMSFLAMLSKRIPAKQGAKLSEQVEQLEHLAAKVVFSAVLSPADCYCVPIDDIDALRGAIRP